MVDTEEIKKRLNIVEVIGEYLTLKRSGTTYKAVCPFHSERTPSFTVSAERGSWHCFGCNEGGDVISFVQKIDGLEFSEALEKLAVKAGVELKPLSAADKQVKSERLQILQVLEHAKNLYHELLLHHSSAQGARDYLVTRGVSSEMIEAFQIGYAPNAWDIIDKMLAKKGIQAKYGVESGLSVSKPSSRAYDRFRNRLMFPIDNPSGQTTGFTGRILEDAPDQPKYVNTSESLVFKKGEALYGIAQARQAIKKQGKVIVVEGQLDVITSHQFGFTNTVATSGTALTQDHLYALKRYTDTIIFAFDADNAGKKALQAATMIALKLEINPLVALIPHGKDPDEAIRHDSDEWKKAIESARPVVEYLIDQALESGEGQLSAIQKKRIIADLQPFLQAVRNEVERADYVRRLARSLGVSDEAIVSTVNSSKEKIQKPTIETTPDEHDEPLDDIERTAVGLILSYPNKVGELPAVTLENKALDEIYQAVRQAKIEKKNIEERIAQFPSNWQQRLNTLILETLRRHEQLEESAISEEIKDTLHWLQDRERDLRVFSNAKAIAAAFSAGNKEEARKLLKTLEHDTIIPES